jgi:ATP synthase protein I
MTAKDGVTGGPRAGLGPGATGPMYRTIMVGLVLTAVAMIPAAGLAGLLEGGGAVLAAVLGLALPGAFFATSKLVLAAVARRWPHALLLTALATYVFKIAILGVVLVSVQHIQDTWLTCFAWSVLAGVVVWVAAEIWVATHTRVPFYDPSRFEARQRERERRPASPPTVSRPDRE